MKLPWYIKMDKKMHIGEKGELCTNIAVDKRALPWLMLKGIIENPKMVKWWQWPLLPYFILKATINAGKKETM